MLKRQGPRTKACEEATMKAKGLPAGKEHTRKDSKVDSSEGNFPREGIGSMLGPGNSKPGLQNQEMERKDYFPRDPGLARQPPS